MVRTCFLVILADCRLAPAPPLFADEVVTSKTAITDAVSETRFKVYTPTPLCHPEGGTLGSRQARTPIAFPNITGG